MDLSRRFLVLNLVSEINPTPKQKELLDFILLECSKAYNEALDLLNKEYAILDSNKQVDPLTFMLRVMKRSEPDIVQESYICMVGTIYSLSSDYSVYLDELLDVWYHPTIKKPQYQDTKKTIHFCLPSQRCDIRDNMIFFKFLEDPIELLSYKKGKTPPSDIISFIRIEVDAFGKYKAIVSYEVTEQQAALYGYSI